MTTLNQQIEAIRIARSVLDSKVYPYRKAPGLNEQEFVQHVEALLDAQEVLERLGKLVEYTQSVN